MDMDKYIVSSSPHIRDSSATHKIMFSVILALVPAVIAGTVFMGMRTLVIVSFSMAAAGFFEAVWLRFMKGGTWISDGSAFVTGLLLGLCMPVTIPLWVVLVGNFFAIIIVKQLFGGLGHNFMNPALAARAFLFAAWPVHMTNWAALKGVDGVSGATALEQAGSVNAFDAFIGNMAGCIGEVSALALLIGGTYLIARKLIAFRTPVAFIATIFICSTIAGQNGLEQILYGGVFLGAFFMATDYVTSPVMPIGHVIMGCGCGLITFAIRRWGGYPEGVTYAILLMNAATPLIDKLTRPKRYGA